MSRNKSSNDQRSDVKNPNNDAHKTNEENRSRQLNPQDKLYGGNSTSQNPKK